MPGSLGRKRNPSHFSSPGKYDCTDNVALSALLQGTKLHLLWGTHRVLHATETSSSLVFVQHLQWAVCFNAVFSHSPGIMTPSGRQKHETTNLMEQRLSRNTNGSSATQETPRISSNPKVHHRIHKRTPPVRLHFSIIPHPRLDLPSGVHHSGFPTKTSPKTCYMLYASQSS